MSEENTPETPPDTPDTPEAAPVPEAQPQENKPKAPRKLTSVQEANMRVYGRKEG